MADQQQQADSPAYQCADYMTQLADWQIVNDVLKGTRQLRRIQTGYQSPDSTAYLPQEPAESPKAYQNRLRKSVFWNAYKRTIQGLTGMVFRKNPQLAEDVPQRIKLLTEDIDLEGSHFDTFSKEVFKAALNDGHTFILVDMPQSVTSRNPAATLADERQAGLRPY